MRRKESRRDADTGGAPAVPGAAVGIAMTLGVAVIVTLVIAGSDRGTGAHFAAGVASTPRADSTQLPAPASTPRPANTQLPTPAVPAVHIPAGRIDHALVGDPVRQGVLLFGGNAAPASSAAPAYLNDTWFWSAGHWRQVAPAASPSARADAAAAFDEARGVAVLFGGVGAKLVGGTPILDDTWIWDGATWSQRQPAHKPPARFAASMAYDPGSGKIVLEGGAGRAGYTIDAWTWDGTDWSLITTSPSLPPHGSVLATSPSGGVIAVGSCSIARGDPGRYEWQQVRFAKTIHPEDNVAFNRCTRAVAFDPRHRSTVAFGGTYGYEDGPFGGQTDGRNSDTLVFDGTAWRAARSSITPPGRQHAAAAFDYSSNTVILFGGDAGAAGRDMQDTWSWTGIAWSQVG